MMSPIILRNQILKMRLRSQWCNFYRGRGATWLFIQGPRSNFEIGGGAPLVTQYWGRAQNTFSY